MIFNFLILTNCSETIVEREHNCLMLLCDCLLSTINHYVASVEMIEQVLIRNRSLRSNQSFEH